jgi:hypothetical protein
MYSSNDKLINSCTSIQCNIILHVWIFKCNMESKEAISKRLNMTWVHSCGVLLQERTENSSCWGMTVLGFKLLLSRQVLYQLSQTPNPFCFGYFSEKVWCFAWGQPWTISNYLWLPPPAYLRWQVHATTPGLLAEMRSP